MADKWFAIDHPKGTAVFAARNHFCAWIRGCRWYGKENIGNLREMTTEELQKLKPVSANGDTK